MASTRWLGIARIAPCSAPSSVLCQTSSLARTQVAPEAASNSSITAYPRFRGEKPSTSLAGVTVLSTAEALMWGGSGSWTMSPSTAAELERACTTASNSACPTTAASLCTLVIIPICASAPHDLREQWAFQYLGIGNEENCAPSRTPQASAAHIAGNPVDCQPRQLPEQVAFPALLSGHLPQQRAPLSTLLPY